MGTALKDSMVLSHALVEPNRAAQWLETIGLMRLTFSLILRCPVEVKVENGKSARGVWGLA